MKNIKYILLWVVSITTGISVFYHCEYPFETSRVTEEVLIGEYFEEHADTFSVMAAILNQTGNMAFLKAYGEYTCFAPTNNAFKNYFIEQGLADSSATNDELVNTVSTMTEDDLTDLVRFYVIKGDTISSEDFVDGPLRTPTMYGQYLTYGTYYEDGEVVGKINKTATIEQADISLLNGIVHSLKSVITPNKLTIAQYIEQLDGYSIFAEALKVTGLYDTLNVAQGPDHDTVWYTFFATSDEILNDDGIYSAEDIGTTYADETYDADSALYMYMAYHILPDQYAFVTDLVSAKAVNTLATGEVLTVKQSGTSVLINDDTFAGVYEPGYEIDRDASDLTVDNGVIHFMEGNFYVKTRYPFAVYWEVTEQTELKKMSGVYKGTGVSGIENGTFEDISWEPEDGTIDYYVGAINGAKGHIYNDYFSIYLRPAVISSITFTTPTMVKGSYKIWICYRRTTTTLTGRISKAYLYFNGEQTTEIFDNNTCYDAAGGEGHYSDGELNLMGVKIYNYDPSTYYSSDSATQAELIEEGIENNWVSEANRYGSIYMGTVNVTETGTQTLQLVAISGGTEAHVYLDQIHFIPTDEDQNWPRINCEDASEVYEEDLEAGDVPVPE